MSDAKTTDTSTPVTMPTRPMRPSDYGSPEWNVPALVIAVIVTVSAVLAIGLAVAS